MKYSLEVYMYPAPAEETPAIYEFAELSEAMLAGLALKPAVELAQIVSESTVVVWSTDDI